MSRTKREYITYSRETYNKFLIENKISESQISFKKWKRILETCNWMYVEYALRTGFKVPLPFGFGAIAVGKKKLKRFIEYQGKRYVNLRIDWIKTRQYGKKIYHTNEHSDGFNFKWNWFPKESKLSMSSLYVFKPGRFASRAIAKYVKKPNSPYKEMYLEWFNKEYKI